MDQRNYLFYQPIEVRTIQDGLQRIYRFSNDYGASVVRHKFSYGGEEGLFELAVIRFTTEHPNDWDITYDTPITKDVIGWLDQDKVQEILGQIKDLPRRLNTRDLVLQNQSV